MSTSTPDVEPKSHWNLPNTLTWLRILMIPGVVILFYLPFWWAHPAAGVGFALATPTATRIVAAVLTPKPGTEIRSGERRRASSRALSW